MGKLLFLVALAIALVVFGPLATIWALNVLFPALAIPFTFDTWLAAFLLFGGAVGARFKS